MLLDTDSQSFDEKKKIVKKMSSLVQIDDDDDVNPDIMDEQNNSETMKSNHWLFQSVQENEFQHPRKNVKRCEVTPEEIEENMNRFVKDLNLLKENLSTKESVKIIPVKSAALKIIDKDDNNPKYLFKNDTMKFPKKFNISCTNKTNKPTASSTRVTSFNPFNTRLQRKAKEKIKSFEESKSDSDDNIFNLDLTKKTEEGQPVNGKSKRKTIFLEELPDCHVTRKQRPSISLKKRKEESIIGEKDDDKEEAQPVKKLKLDFVKNTKEKLSGVLSNFFNGHSKNEHAQNNNVNGVKEEKEIEETVVVPDEVNCPMCNKLFLEKDINQHAFSCNGPVSPIAVKTRTKSKMKNVASQEGNFGFDESAWKQSCKGLNEKSSTSKSSQDYIDRPPKKALENPWKEEISDKREIKNPKNENKIGSNNSKIANNDKSDIALRNLKMNAASKKTEIIMEELISDDDSDEAMEGKNTIKTDNQNNNKYSNINGTMKKQVNVNKDNNDDKGKHERELFLQYIGKSTNGTKKLKQNRAYNQRNFGNLDDSELEEQKNHEKCFRCSDWFLSGQEYNDHVSECVERTVLEMTVNH